VRDKAKDALGNTVTDTTRNTKRKGRRSREVCVPSITTTKKDDKLAAGIREDEPKSEGKKK